MERKTAEEILVESFRELAAKRNVAKITIKDITDNCGYSPATFYRHFKDKYDLIAWDYTREVERIMSKVGSSDDCAWTDTLMDAAKYFDEQKKYLANLFLHTSGMDAFITYMREINFSILNKCVLKVSGLKELDEKTMMYIRIYVLGTVQLICEWITGNYTAGPEEVADVFEKALPEPLQKYLY